MKIHTPGLVTLLLAGSALPAVAQDGALAAYLDQPDVYIEVFDLSALEGDVRSTGIGRLVARFLPLLEEHVQQREEVIERLGVDPLALGSGELSWEDALAMGIARAARDELGMSESDAVRVAASLGSRFSVALDAVPGGGHDGDGEWTVSWSLRSGGSDVFVDVLAPQIERVAGDDAPELLHLQRGEGGARGAWKVEDGEAFVVVRPDLVAITSSEATARLLLESAVGARDNDRAGARSAVSSPFDRARGEVIGRSESLWVWMDGSALRLAAAEEGGQALECFGAAGLDQIENLQLSLSASGGQLSSRLRLQKSGRAGVLGLVRAHPSEWTGLELLTSDVIGVVGLARSPVELAYDLTELAGRLDDASEIEQALAMAESAPLLGHLLEPDAVGDEAVLFVRPGAAGLPMVYVAMPATAHLREVLAGLSDGQTAFGGELRLRVKEVDGRRCWMLSEGGHGYGLAVALEGESVLASYSLLSLQDYLRQRGRERPSDRANLVAGVRASMRQAGADSGYPASAVAGFAHVRVEPLAEFVWPWVMMGLSMSGAHGLEDLPDALEIAEEVGDTTLILFESDDAIELRGRGLFGGLGVLF